MKTFKSERLMIAFLEFMFEDIEPEWLTEEEYELFDSLRVRMENCKKKSDAWSMSHWGWRPKKDTSEKQHKNNTKTTDRQQDKDKEEDKEYKIKNKNKELKNKYLDFVYLSGEEHQKLITQLGSRQTDELIDKLNNYIWSTWKKYKSHYFTILNRAKKEWGTATHSQAELLREKERQRRLEEAQEVLNRSKNKDGDNTNNETFNRRANLMSS